MIRSMLTAGKNTGNNMDPLLRAVVDRIGFYIERSDLHQQRVLPLTLLPLHLGNRSEQVHEEVPACIMRLPLSFLQQPDHWQQHPTIVGCTRCQAGAEGRRATPTPKRHLHRRPGPWSGPPSGPDNPGPAPHSNEQRALGSWPSIFSGSLSNGAIIGIVVSCVRSVIGLLFGIWFRFYKLRRKEKREVMEKAQEKAQLLATPPTGPCWAQGSYPVSLVSPAPGPISWKQPPPPPPPPPPPLQVGPAPEGYEADEDYIACCYWWATITTAKGPDGSMSPACCPTIRTTCRGAVPVMYDWTTDKDGYMIVITPPDKTTKMPETNEPEITTTDFAEPTTTKTEDDDSPWDTITPTSRATGSTSESSDSRDSSDSNSGSGLGSGAIAGIVVSCVCSVLGLIFGIWFRFYKLRRREKKEAEQAQMLQQQQSWTQPSYPTSPVPPVSGPIQWPQAPPPTRLTGGWVR
ncbi:hypothetical protein VTJ04DRAFT_3219 [Mycothermus thermophilus]|uniref:uncharacterized protein n=1 Tax=Humicola insolens TaxID=85995 RepID=UPI0037433138